ncbi:MAG: hypothetical protein K2H52_17865 [Lachnospiraceae bacterium]|nr:hypothetical protein [Lachnospiraceae bacterium]
MNRFTTQAEKRRFHLPHMRLTYLIGPVILIIFVLSLSFIGDSTVSRQKESLETALNRDIIHCYAVEGFYPPSLTYIEEHYGLTYNHDLFFVDYQPIGSNMRPDVTILVR